MWWCASILQQALLQFKITPERQITLKIWKFQDLTNGFQNY